MSSGGGAPGQGPPSRDGSQAQKEIQNGDAPGGGRKGPKIILIATPPQSKEDCCCKCEAEVGIAVLDEEEAAERVWVRCACRWCGGRGGCHTNLHIAWVLSAGPFCGSCKTD